MISNLQFNFLLVLLWLLAGGHSSRVPSIEPSRVGADPKRLASAPLYTHAPRIQAECCVTVRRSNRHLLTTQFYDGTQPRPLELPQHKTSPRAQKLLPLDSKSYPDHLIKKTPPETRWYLMYPNQWTPA